MIDFKDCPKDETWLLFDSDGNCEFMADEIKLAYACYQIAKEKLEGYFLVNVNDFIRNPNGYEKYPSGSRYVVQTLSLCKEYRQISGTGKMGSYSVHLKKRHQRR